MKTFRILVLVHEDLIPPASLDGYQDEEIVHWKTEYDVVTTLKELGHDVQVLGVRADLGVIRTALLEFKPQIAFNLLEEFHDNPLYDHHVAGYLELMQQTYTGCNPRGLLIAHDKALSKKILSFHRIRVPRFGVFPRGRKPRLSKKLRYPLIVKSLYEEGSYGISQASIVRTDDK
jgi:D-alanine-D-alanine ligase